MNDLFGAKAARKTARAADAYSAKDIEVLEGLEPVRRRPGMYIGGTDETALHHLAAEILDNAMDEAVAGHASFIEVSLEPDNWLTVRDNGRGIPVDPHPKFKNLSALEVILTTLHSGGKFGGKVYATSGGLHGVGSSVVNALSEVMEVEVARDRVLWKQSYARGKPTTKLINAGPVHNRRGTSIRFKPDPQIFGALRVQSRRGSTGCAAPRPTCSAAWKSAGPCDPALLKGAKDDTPAEAVLHFPGGLRDSLEADIGAPPRVLPQLWAGEADLPGEAHRQAWNGRSAWLEEGEGFLHSYCNTVPTPQGGTHEAGFRAALLKGLRAWGEQRGNRRAAQVTAEDVLDPMAAKLSVFLRDPQFQGQTKEKLTSAEATRLVETALRDRFDHFLAGDPDPGRQPAGLRHRARRGTPAAQGKQGHRAQVADAAAAPARQADRLHAGERRGDRDLPGRGRQRRRLGQAGAQPRDPGGAAAARQDPERRQRLGRQAAAEPGAEGPDRGAGLRRRRPLRPRQAALWPGHHHDRRRRGRRAHRLAADDVLLPRAAGAGAARPRLPGAAAAVPADPGREVGLRDGRRRPRAQDEARVQGRREGGGQPLQGPGRDAAGAVARRPRWTRRSARC